MATFTDDAVIMAPDQPAVRGSAEVRSWAAENYFDPYEIDMDFSYEEVEFAGSWGVVIGPFSQKLTPKAGGDTMEIKGKFVDVVRRDSDGSWKFSRVMFNGDEPASAG